MFTVEDKQILSSLSFCSEQSVEFMSCSIVTDNMIASIPATAVQP